MWRYGAGWRIRAEVRHISAEVSHANWEYLALTLVPGTFAARSSIISAVIVARSEMQLLFHGMQFAVVNSSGLFADERIRPPFSP
jgi:hypothetical protein